VSDLSGNGLMRSRPQIHPPWSWNSTSKASAASIAVSQVLDAPAPTVQPVIVPSKASVCCGSVQ
jgi:hypothetical protein